MSTIAEIQEQLADTIREALSGNGVDLQVEPRLVLYPTPITIDIYPGHPSRDPEPQGFAAPDDDPGAVRLTVRARVPNADIDAGQDLLLGLMDEEDPLCLPLAVLEDTTLNGHAAQVTVADEYPSFEQFPDASGLGAYIGLRFLVTVYKAQS